MTFIRKFLENRSGATAIEYGLIAALICIAIISGITAFGTATGNIFDTLSTTVSNAMAGL